MQNKDFEELEKRIYFTNQNANDVQTNLNNLQTEVDTLSENVETNSDNISTLQQSVSTLETWKTTHHDNYMTLCESMIYVEQNAIQLEGEIDDNRDSIAGHEGRISSLEDVITEQGVSDFSSQISDLETSVSNLETANTSINTTISGHTTQINNLDTAVATNTSHIATNTNDIANHNNRITALEGVSSGSLPKYYGTHIEDISQLENDVLTNEPEMFNGGTGKFTYGTKSPNGPYGTLFTRINPAINPQFTGTLLLTLKDVPTGTTTTTLNFKINGVTTELTPNIIDDTITIPFDFITNSVSNRFDIEFTDVLLAETYLEYIEITCTQGINFAPLNRDNRFIVQNHFSISGNEYWFIARNQGSNHRFCNIKNNSNILYGGGYVIRNQHTSYNSNYYRYNIIKVGSYYEYSVSSQTYSNILSYAMLLMVNSDNSLVRFREYFATDTLFCNNIFDANLCYYDTNTKYHQLCGITYENQVVIGKDQTDILLPTTLNDQNLPNEFIQCEYSNDRKKVYHTPFCSGFLLLHQSGEIIFIPNKNSTYFIPLGKGLQVRGELQANQTQINVYYQNFQRTKIIKKILNFNSNTNRWELSTKWQVYNDITELYEYGENQMTIKQNNSYLLVEKY